MHTEITLNELVSITEVQPRHGGTFVADFLQRQQLTITEAAKLVGCARSTLHRFIASSIHHFIKGGRHAV